MWLMIVSSETTSEDSIRRALNRGGLGPLNADRSADTGILHRRALRRWRSAHVTKNPGIPGGTN